MKGKLYALFAILLVLSLILAACGDGDDEKEEEPQATATTAAQPTEKAPEPTAEEPKAEGCVGEGKILLWHAWTGAEAEAMDEILAGWQAYCPSIEVEVLAVSFDELRNKYETASASGGGPDLFIAPTDWVGGMAEAGLIAPIDDLADKEFLGRFIPTTVDALRYKGELYGIPESFEAVAMFYRTDLVDTPPTTLDEWLAMAAEGHEIAINSGFYHAFWGIQAFGGKLFDENGIVILDQGPGVVSYLSWLAEAKEAPGVVMDPDGGKLDSLFKEGEVAFVLNGPWASGDYQGAEKIAGNVGVAPIPAGPAGPSGPFLGIKEFLFNSASSDEQLMLALEFVKYVTNVENETMLMEQANHLPANKNVDTSGNPIVAGFVEQAQTAVPFPNIPQMGAVWGPAGDMITKVIEGAASPEEAVAEATALINQANWPDGLPTATCEGSGKILLWHAWTGAEAEVLDEILTGWQAYCPGIEIEVLAVSFDELRNKYETASASGGGPDLFIAPTDWVGGMAEAGLIAPIDGLVDASLLQRYIPTTVDALRYQGELYGLPESFEAVAMFYRTDLVDTPPATLDEWLAMAAEGHEIAINSGFYHAFWGIQAFGGQLFDANGVVVLDEGGTVDYLNWLAEAKEAPGVVMDPDGGKLDSLFKEGEVAFVLNGPWASGDYQGAEKIAGNVGVAPIPSGPAGPSGPFLGIKEFLFNSASSDEQLMLAIEFVKYMTNRSNSTMLMEEANHLPANRSVDTSGNAVVAGFVEQAQTAVPFPNIPQMGAVWGPAGDMITKVVEGAASAEDAVAEAVSLINQANFPEGVPGAEEPEPEPEPEPAACEGEGEILLWHAWTGAEAEAMDEILTKWQEFCPSIEVDVLAVSFDELRNKYETASASGGGPDLFIAPTDWVGGMAEAGLIAPIDDLAAEDFLGRFIPTTVDALRYQGELYGIPESFEAVAMFYRTDLIDTPPTTLDDWLAMAAEGNEIAINSGFYHAFWGIQAFGGQLFDEDGVVILDQGGTVDYLNWLAEAKEAPGVVMDPDGGKLDSLFKEGEVAFVLNGPWASGDYQGAEKIAGNVGVAPIPAGPAGPSGPFLGIKEFLFNSASSDEQLMLALEFVKFVTNVENETLLMEQANHLPANKNVDTSDNAIVAGFVAQAETAVPFPNIPEMGAVWGPAGDMITKVVEGASSAEDAVAEAVSLINQANQK